MSQEGKEEASMSLSLFKRDKQPEAAVVPVEDLKKIDGMLKKQKPKLEEKIKAEYQKIQKYTAAAEKNRRSLYKLFLSWFDLYASHECEKKMARLQRKLAKLKRDEFDVEIQITLRTEPEAEKEPIYDDDKRKICSELLRKKDMTMNSDELRGTINQSNKDIKDMQLKPLAKFGRSLKKPFISMKSNLS